MKSPTVRLCSGTLWILALLLAGAGTAQGRPEYGPLTQADIDGYVFLLPRLIGEAAQDSRQGAGLLREAGLSRKRAAYVGAKVAIAQALVSGLLSSSQLTADSVPPHLQPSAEELTLVNDNLATLLQAQEAARRAARRPEAAPSP